MRIKIDAVKAEVLVTAVDHDTEYRSGSCSSVLTRFDNQVGTMDFATHCANSGYTWTQRAHFPDWATVVPKEEMKKLTTLKEAREKYPEIVEMDVEVSCNCPAALYEGPLFSLDTIDSGEKTLPRYENAPIPETRPPDIRDPGRTHNLCKHLVSVIKLFLI
jgi:hypothetical protein